VEREIAELATVLAALGQDFQQMDELVLLLGESRDGHARVEADAGRIGICIDLGAENCLGNGAGGSG
jgi:hypothetical protein